MVAGGQRNTPPPPIPHPPPRFTPGKETWYRFVQGTGWAPGLVWTGSDYLASTGIRSPDRPDRSESLYRLSCPNYLQIKGLQPFYVEGPHPLWADSWAADENMTISDMPKLPEMKTEFY